MMSAVKYAVDRRFEMLERPKPYGDDGPFSYPMYLILNHVGKEGVLNNLRAGVKVTTSIILGDCLFNGSGITAEAVQRMPACNVSELKGDVVYMSCMVTKTGAVVVYIGSATAKGNA